ncbi:hypothetical protein LCGC14_1757000 [marine sediment metagenome]|uniref:6-pyruvoyl tetrahydropterin synthase n=1 Tax=marine sediment metagenome TaxID=412755 RepID=A0A0F9K1S5_9ZZZZ
MLTVRTQIEAPGYHYWPAVSGESFLGNLHRHMFTFSAELRVDGVDREVEFFALQDQMRAILAHPSTPFNGLLLPRVGVAMSCEALAQTMGELLGQFGYSVASCSVSEDGESEGIWYNDDNGKA